MPALYELMLDGPLESHLGQEWLLTNGIGGFSSSTVLGCNTRRYHGLLCAATLPPVGRIMALNRIGETLILDGNDDRRFEFSLNQFGQTFFPRGDQYLKRMELDREAVWHYEVEGVRVVKRVQILWNRNVVGVRYDVHPGTHANVELRLMPFTSLRDFHATRREQGARFDVHANDAQNVTVSDGGNLMLHLHADAGAFEQNPSWWHGHTYRIESERGLDDTEDLFAPGAFVLKVNGSAQITLWAALELLTTPNWDEELTRGTGFQPVQGGSIFASTQHGLKTRATSDSPVIHKLTRAANDFIVTRKTPDGSLGTSILAGYPWFADWGRDTFISLPGLLLTTKRFQEAAQVLTVFAHYVSEGMIPNRFDDYTNEPSYNTVDASLWFIHSAFEFARLSGDRQTFETKLLPACRAIVEGYKNGTRYNIGMDPADGLITQGDASTQLTWMDAKHDNIAFTPRQGKAVEINALWYHVLELMGDGALAAHVGTSFVRTFWLSPFRGLYDVVDGNRKDGALRPNQIFAVSLPNSPLSAEQQAAVVEVVRRELLTPYGLRTLARNDPNYHGHYGGPPAQRDKAYHNGTVWPWPIGAFLEAYLKVNHRSPQSIDQSRRWLQPLIDHLNTQACIGQISEVFDGDEPHRPGGCCAQAWSVAEVLRLAVELEM